MTRFFGAVGYGEQVEKSPGIYEDIIVERNYYGDITRNTRILKEGQSVNDDLSVNNSISIVADAYAYEHFYDIRYVQWTGVLWKVSEVDVQNPRLIFRLGGKYNGPTPDPITP